jgi:hypothetical protein
VVRSGDLRGGHGNGRGGPCALVRDARPGLVTHWPSVLASANPLCKGQRFARPSRKDAGRDLRGRRNGVFQVSRTKPCAQFEPFMAEMEHGHWLNAELDRCEFKGRFVGYDPLPFVPGPVFGLLGRGGSAAPSSCGSYRSPTSRRVRQGNVLPPRPRPLRHEVLLQVSTGTKPSSPPAIQSVLKRRSWDTPTASLCSASCC